MCTDPRAFDFCPMCGEIREVTKPLFVGIRVDASGLLIPALTVRRPAVEVELNYQGAMLPVRFDGFGDLFETWNDYFSRPDLSKQSCLLPCFLMNRPEYCEIFIFSVMRPTVFVHILRNWILTHLDELSSGVGTLMNWPVGEEILNGLVSVCHWPETVDTAPSPSRRATFARTRRTMSQIAPGVLDALQKVGILEELKSKLSVEARDMVDWDAKVFKEAFAEELAAEEAEEVERRS